MQQVKPAQQNEEETLFVLGTYSISSKSTYNPAESTKFLHCVNKQGQEIDLIFSAIDSCEHVKSDVVYVQRGDTIVVQKDKFIKNLTQEKLKEKFLSEQFKRGR